MCSHIINITVTRGVLKKKNYRHQPGYEWAKITKIKKSENDIQQKLQVSLYILRKNVYYVSMYLCIYVSL
jgi:hypothetical protein